MKQNIVFFLLICSLQQLVHGSCPLPLVPHSGTRFWNVAVEDLFVDITTLSRVSTINSEIDVLSSNIALITSLIQNINSVDQIISSEVMVIDTRTSNIQSTVNNIYSLDQTIASNVNNIFKIDTSINSVVDIINITDQTILSKLIVIDTRTSNIQSNINNIYILDQTTSSNLDVSISIEDAIISKIEALSTCCTNTTSSQPFISIYATEEIGNRLDSINIQFQYGIPSSTTTSYTQGGGTVTNSNSMAILTTAAAPSSIAQLQSKGSLVYRSGHNAYAIFTVAFTGSFTATSSQFIGPIDYQNGYAIGFNGPLFGITMRNNANGTINDTFIPQASFNGDTLTGAGPSGFIYNPAVLNVFRIDYGDPGSVIKFSIMNSTGSWINFHTINFPNTSATPSILQPFLPVTARVENLAGASVLRLETAAWDAGIVGSPNYYSYRYFEFDTTVSTASSNPVSAFTIMNSAVFNNQPNHIQARIAVVAGGPTNDNNLPVATIFLYKNATVTGTSFTPVNSGNSIMQVSTSGTYVVGTGTLMYSCTGRATGNSPFIVYLTDRYPIVLYPGETLTVAVKNEDPADAGSITIAASVSWEEQF